MLWEASVLWLASELSEAVLADAELVGLDEVPDEQAARERVNAARRPRAASRVVMGAVS